LLVIPLAQVKGGMPATLYLGGLVVLHVLVLVVYCYRVKFTELDPDLRSLVARIAALVFVGYLLAAVSSFDEQTPVSTLLAQMLGVSLLHTLILALLMFRLSYERRPAPGRLTEEPADS
jgi:hypothetical protein